MKTAVLYARVSSKEQEKEGFSIPSQLKLLRDYATNHSMIITAEFIDVETAGKSGRENFNSMCQLLRKTKGAALLVEKTDRLYRNFRDYVIIEELESEIHLVKEGAILSKDSRSHDKFIHGIKVLMAKNFLDNLREETQKGMREKAEQGIYPSTPPYGYRNVLLPDGRRGIEIDEERAREVAKLFDLYATGHFSLKSLPGPKWIYSQRLKKLFDNPFYYGEFHWKGLLYRGSHEPIVTRELWQQCQDILHRNARRTRRPKQAFPFSGLVHCGFCGRLLIGRIHKQRYVYYHCKNTLSVCSEPYLRQETLEQAFTQSIKSLRFTFELAERIKIALKESASKEERFRANAVRRLRTEYDHIQKRLERAYMDKLDDRIEPEFFNRLSAGWRKRQDEINAELAAVQRAGRIYIDESIALLDLCQEAGDLFEVQPTQEKRRLIEIMCLNSVWSQQTLKIQWNPPFDSLQISALSTEASPRGQWLDSLIQPLLFPSPAAVKTYEKLRAA